MVEKPVVDREEIALNNVILREEQILYPFDKRIRTVTTEPMKNKEKNVFISVERKKSLILPFNSRKRREKSRVPSIISCEVIISIERES